jgi:hypothetical protein
MTLVNLTPHPLNLLGEDGTTREIPSSGIARISMTTHQVGFIAGYRLVLLEPGDIEGLPAPLPGVVYIVSALVAQAVPEREDVVSPAASSGAIRDIEGYIVAVRGFVRFSPQNERKKSRSNRRA